MVLLGCTHPPPPSPHPITPCSRGGYETFASPSSSPMLPQLKKALKDDDASKDEAVAQAHIEEFAFKLFETADNEDRAGRFHK